MSTALNNDGTREGATPSDMMNDDDFAREVGLCQVLGSYVLREGIDQPTELVDMLRLGLAARRAGLTVETIPMAAAALSVAMARNPQHYDGSAPEEPGTVTTSEKHNDQ